MGAELSVRGLTRQYGTNFAVAGIDFKVQAGEFVSLLGPSGCGKTTTLRMIAGLEAADGGEIWIDGRDITSLPPQARNLGMVFQHYALFPNLSAFENIAFPLRVRRMPKHEIQQRVSTLLETVRLSEDSTKYPHELSGGMQQRVALARALAIAPPLLLLDEPLSALDAAIRDSLRVELRRLQRQLGVTVIYVTHDQAEAMALSDTIVVMENGRISQSGPPRELYDRPRTTFTANFVGTNNRRQTSISRRGEYAVVKWGDYELPVSPDSSFADQQPVTATWRPEVANISIDSKAGGIPGTIELITFLGPMTRFDVLLAGDSDPVTVDLVSGLAGSFQHGQTVSVTIPPESIRLYANEKVQATP
jgi:putative spermidine/putrescine transport system ATP-binding protein